MKNTISKSFKFPGKILLAVAAFFMLTISPAVAQSNCVKADFEYAVDHGSKSIKLRAKGSSNVILYTWQIDSGQATGASASYQFSSAGTYKVCLTAYGLDAKTQKRCSVTVCKQVTIKQCTLKADFDLKQDGSAIKVEAKSNSRDAVYGWTFGDGKSARGQTAGHRYAKDGKYSVCLFVKDTSNGCYVRLCKDVTVRTCNLKAAFKFEQDGNDFKFKAEANQKNVHFYWNFGDSTRGKGGEVKHSYNGPGVYNVCLTAVSANSTGSQKCTTTVCKRVEVKRKCNLKVEFKYEQKGNDFRFKAESNQRNVRYFWSFGDDSDGKGQEVKHSYKKPGTYRVCVTAVSYDANGKTICKVTECKKVEVKRDNDCDLKANFKYEIDGQKIRVKAEANQSGVLFYWSWGDGSSDHGQTANHKYKKYGVYEVCLIAFNPKTKCKVCVCKKVEIKRDCKLKADFRYAIDGLSVKMKGRSNAPKKAVVYGWKMSDGSAYRGREAKHTFSKPGTYAITMYAYDTRTGCSVQVSKRVIVYKRNLSIPAPPNPDDLNTNAVSESSTSSAIKIDWSATATPVPAQSNVTFSSQEKVLSHVTVYGLDGNTLIDTDLNVETEEKVDITLLPTGLYFAHVTAVDGTVQIVKFVKN